MKTLIISFCVLFNTAASFAQGLVNFSNTPTTAVEIRTLNSTTGSILSAPAGSYYFGLFLGQFNSSYFFTGIFATNTSVNGLFNGGVQAVPGWAAGTTTNYFIVGWEADMGKGFQTFWISGVGVGIIGTSGIGSGIAGDGISTPALNLFDGGGNTLQIGFILLDHTIPEVPEASTISIAGLGVGIILLYRLRNKSLRKQ